MSATSKPARRRRPKEHLAIQKLCRAFLAAPTSAGTLEALCAALVEYELRARLMARIAADDEESQQRAEVKALDLCRDCRVKLDTSNRAGVSGYQCITCKRQYEREYQRQRRAKQKAVSAS